MPDLLIRDLPAETKRRLAIRAAENGRSQSAEAASILEEVLAPPQKSWVLMLREAALEAGGFELERPDWAASREFSFDSE